MKDILLSTLPNFAVGVSIIPLVINASSNDAHAAIDVNSTSGTSTNIYEINQIFPQHPMGKELDDILMSNSEFKHYFDEFNQELNDDLDRRYRDRKISAMKYYRMKNSMTQAELAEKIGDTQSHISRWESKRNLNTITAKKLNAIAEALSISMKELLNGYQS